MAFTYEQAYTLLKNAHNNGRQPHALLFTGSPDAGTHRLALTLAAELNGARATGLEGLQHPNCRVLRPGSKIRTISIDAVRSVEPFLALRADEGATKLIIIDEADRLLTEAANAFLKTLEEPPPQTLIILITEIPSKLLPTILSRCVRIDLRDSRPGVRLSRVQELFLPSVKAALPRVGNDVAALALRADFQALLAKRKDEITERITSALKAEAKTISEGTDIKNWEAMQKDTTNARIESEYLGEREQMLELLTLCLGQAVLIASHAPDVRPLAPELADLANKCSVADLLRRMRAVDELRTDLSYNVNEALALDSRLLDIIGKSPL
ncbi:MAG: AAA family ATPase [Akkermansia sp.]|nr:AAA family ATPase [Akkermansia sp.]